MLIGITAKIVPDILLISQLIIASVFAEALIPHFNTSILIKLLFRVVKK